MLFDIWIYINLCIQNTRNRKEKYGSRKDKVTKILRFCKHFHIFSFKNISCFKIHFYNKLLFQDKMLTILQMMRNELFINNAVSRFIQNVKSWIQLDDLHKIVLFWEKPVLFEIMYSYFITILIIICEYKIH